MLYVILLVAAVFGLSSGSAWAAEAASLNAPRVSLNALFLYRDSNLHMQDADPAAVDQKRNGFNIQETELQFFSDVDPYTRLNVVLSVHPEYQATTGDEKWILEPEEAFAESLALQGVVLKLGKFKAALGKHNQLHTHAFPFVDAPLVHQALLGDEGFNDVGLSAAALLPVDWFSEMTFEYLRGEGENKEFKSPTPSDGVGLMHWKNLVDLNEDLTMELGGSYAEGGNSFRAKTAISAADLTFKWRPSEGGRYQSFLWGTEYLSRVQSQSGGLDEKGRGVATWLQYQFAERWVALYRFDNLIVEDSLTTTELLNGTSERHSIALSYLPSEFSVFKLQVAQRHGGVTTPDGKNNEKMMFLQANFTIGAHPAHAY